MACERGEKDDMGIDFLSKYKICVAVSLVIIIVGLGAVLVQGLNLGVDFVGGSLIYVNIGKPYSADDVRDVLSSEGINATVVQAGENRQDAIIRMRYTENQEEIIQRITSALKQKYDLTEERFSIDAVGPTVGRELTLNAIQAVLIAWVLILIYIWIRFELKSGVAAIIALIHDILVMFAAIALLGTQINSPFVAGMLTIIGYSINDTIVVFDRVRENHKRFGKKMSRDEILNKSLNETIIRSINTSFTTLVTITALYVLGVESIKEFSLPLLIGVISGTYSSIFIAGPIWAKWPDKSERVKAAAAK
jgi:preprotein translocase SecF subunit